METWFWRLEVDFVSASAWQMLGSRRSRGALCYLILGDIHDYDRGFMTIFTGVVGVHTRYIIGEVSLGRKPKEQIVNSNW